MLSRGTAIFLQCPVTRQRLLRPGVIQDISGEVCQLELTDEMPPPAPSDIGLIMYDLKGDFVQQPILTRAVLRQCPIPVISLALTGSPVNAENRQCFRASTLFVNALSARVGFHPNCTVQDVSTTGFSAVGPSGYDKGRILSVALTFNGNTYEGNAAIQSVSSIDMSTARYGLHCIDDFGPLPDGLRDVAMAVQRRHLKNRRGR